MKRLLSELWRLLSNQSTQTKVCTYTHLGTRDVKKFIFNIDATLYVVELDPRILERHIDGTQVLTLQAGCAYLYPKNIQSKKGGNQHDNNDSGLSKASRNTARKSR